MFNEEFINLLEYGIFIVPALTFATIMLFVSIFRFKKYKKIYLKFDIDAPLKSYESNCAFHFRIFLSFIYLLYYAFFPFRIILIIFSENLPSYLQDFAFLLIIRDFYICLIYSILHIFNIKEQNRKIKPNYAILLIFHLGLISGMITANIIHIYIKPIEMFKLVENVLYFCIRVSFSAIFVLWYFLKKRQINLIKSSDLSINFIESNENETSFKKKLYVKIEKTDDKKEFIVKSFCNFILIGENKRSNEEIEHFFDKMISIYSNEELKNLKHSFLTLEIHNFALLFTQKVLQNEIYLCPTLKDFIPISNQKIKSKLFQHDDIFNFNYQKLIKSKKSMRYKYPIAEIRPCFSYYFITIQSSNEKILDCDLSTNLMIEFKGKAKTHVYLQTANMIVNEILTFEGQNNFIDFSKCIQDLEITLNLMINECAYRYKKHKLIWNLPEGWDSKVDISSRIQIRRSDIQINEFLTMYNDIRFIKKTIYVNGLDKNQEIIRDFLDFEILLESIRKRLRATSQKQLKSTPVLDTYCRYKVGDVVNFLNDICQQNDNLEMIELRIFLLIN